MTRARSAGVVLALVIGLLPGLVAAQDALITNVTPAFRPGAYLSLRVDPRRPERVAVGTTDGYVLWSGDGGQSADESRALSPREYIVMVLRGGGGGPRLFAGSQVPGRGAHRLFISLLHAGLPHTRWASWMSMDSPPTDVSDISFLPDGKMAIASAAGILISSAQAGSWTRTIGSPKPRGTDTMGFAVAADPGDPRHLLASTSKGLKVSHNGGHTFLRHPDARLEGEQIRGFYWNVKEPKEIFAYTWDTIIKSEDRGVTWNAVLSVPGDVNALSFGDDISYVATSKGLMVYGGEEKPLHLFKDEPVIGVVALDKGAFLAATEGVLYLVEAGGGQRVLMRTTASDPFLKLDGGPEIAWALTRDGIYRIGAVDARQRREVSPPKLNLSIEAVQQAVIRHMGIGKPEDTRFADRWYAKFLPRVYVTVQGGRERRSDLVFDGTFPVRYRQASGNASAWCCGMQPGSDGDVLVMAKWDLASLIAGIGNVTNPHGFLERTLRDTKEQIMSEVRWRYRELANLAHLLKHPPTDPKVELMWNLRLDEHAAYLEALSGREVVAHVRPRNDLEESE